MIDRDLIQLAETEPRAIRDAKALLTVVDGQVVYKDPEMDLQNI